MPKHYPQKVKANVTSKQARAVGLRARIDGMPVGEVIRRALDAYLFAEKPR